MAESLGRINKIRKDRHPKNFQISAFNHRSVYVGVIRNFGPPKFRNLKPPEIGKVK